MSNMEKALTKLKEAVIDIEKAWQELSYNEHWTLFVKNYLCDYDNLKHSNIYKIK